jgi:hypothetical protein
MGVSIYILTKQKVILISNTGMTVTKNIEIFDYKLPVSATAMWNPAIKLKNSIRCRSILNF